MASSILRSCKLACNPVHKMQPVPKKILFHGSNMKRQNIFAASSSMIIHSVRHIADGRKDDLYRQITVEVKGHDSAVLNSYQKFTEMAAKELGVTISRIFEPPKVITRKSLLKSVFVHKKHFHQYEMRTLYKVFELKHLTGSTASTFLEYIQRNLPEGVAMKVTKHQINKFPEHLKPPTTAALPNSSSSPSQEQSPETVSDIEKGTSEASNQSPSLSTAPLS